MPTNPFTGEPQSYSGYAGAPSAEASRFGERQQVWATSSGTQGEAVTFASQVVSLSAAAFAGYAAWNTMPTMLRKTNSLIQSNEPLGFKGFKANTGQTNVDFWYQFSRRLENLSPTASGAKGGIGKYFGDLSNMFARSMYVSESLSFFVDRGSNPIFLDIGSKGLGAQGRQDTLEYLSRIGISKKSLHGIDNLAFVNGELFTASRSLVDGQEVLKPGQLLKSGVRLPDFGRVAMAYLTSFMPELGIRDSRTGAIRAQALFGKSGYVPVLADQGDISILGKKFNVPMASTVAKSYGAMSLQRTSFLIEEMMGEAKKFLEFFDKESKSKAFGTAYRMGAVPRVNVGSASSMVFRYSGLAMKMFAGFAALNQAGFMLQDQGAVSAAIGGSLQAGMLGLAGHKAASILGKNPTTAAIGGAALGLMGMVDVGPFKDGVLPGVARTVGRLNEFRSRVGEFIGMNQYRRSIERVAPGATDFSTAIGMGIAAGVVGTAAMRHMTPGVVVSGLDRRRLIAALDFDKLKDLPTASYTPETKDLYESINPEVRAKVRTEISQLISEMREAGNAAELNNPFGKPSDTPAVRASRLGDLLTTKAYERTRKEINEGSMNVVQKTLKSIKHMPFARAAVYSSILATGAYAFATGQLGTALTPGEVRLRNEGKILEPVRRGQRWEFGSTPYEGSDILYYRPTWIARVASGATQAGSTGERGALEEFVLKNFTYKLEKENYFNRPAPITSAAFDQVPFMYPLIKPIADLIKRPKLMNVDQFARIGEGGRIEYLERSTGLDALPDPSLGGISMPAPYSPYAPGRVYGQAFEELTNLAGLVGFYARTGLKAITGSDGFFGERKELESFSENMDMTSRFYDMHTGGGFLGIPFLSEPIRRFLVKSKADSYNPIANTMPDFLPEELRYGNPYVSLRGGGGEYRMPGEGYARRFSELKGVDPSNYPLLHQLNILGDVAPYSKEYRSVKSQVARKIKSGEYDENAARFFYNYTDIVETRMDKRSYDRYVYDQSQYQNISGTIDSVDPLTGTFTLKGSRGRYSVAGISNSGQDLVAQLNLNYQETAKVQRQNAKAFGRVIRPGADVSLQVSRSLSNVDSRGARAAAVTVDGENANRILRREGSFAAENSDIGMYAMANDIGRMFGAGYQSATHMFNKIAAPIEYLTTFGMSPMQKFLPERDVLEEYEQMHMYGEDIRLWQKPFSHWFAPAFRTAARNWLGMKFESPSLARNRNIEEYFDKLKYYKYSMLAEEARTQNDIRSAKHYESVAGKTVIGGHGFYHEDRFKNLLGGTESRYGLGFARESNPERREGILGAMPDYKARLLSGQYAFQEMGALQRMSLGGGLNEEQSARLQQLYQLKQDEGFARTKKNLKAYSRHGAEGESFADYMRKAEMVDWLQKNDVPQPDWIGFNPAVDTEDIKLKYLETEGLDYHDFGIYPSRASYIHRKPYITADDMQFIGIYHGALGHAQDGLREAMNLISNPYSNVSHQIQGGNRMTSYAQLDLTQEHAYIPTDF